MTLETTTPKDQVKAVLDDCQRKVSEIIGKPVNIMYRIRVNNLNPQIILQTVCAVTNLTHSEIRGKSQEKPFVVARNLVAWLVTHYCGLEEKRVADMINRDRSLVSRCIETVNNMLDTEDPLYLQPLRKIEKLILNITNEPA